ncbi:MAG: VCBS repeat-containing protein [Myxococcales bacterium]|nr:VCBS repeat-containing protein [Myxococcales bacterium]
MNAKTHRRPLRAALLGALPLALACTSDDGSADSATSSTGASATTSMSSGGTTSGTNGETSGGSGSATSTTGTGTTGASSSSTGGDTTATSTGAMSTGSTSGTTDATTGTTGEIDVCKVSDDMDAIVPCVEEGPPNSFEPDIQWTFTDPGEPQSYVTPLVANLTDDDNNGEIDLCDVPDVILVAGATPGPPNAVGHIFVISGDTGALHFRIETPVDANFTPAIGDIDGDGLVEIVTAQPNGPLVAFEHDGALKWSTPVTWGIGDFFNQDLKYSNSAALADLDNDGDVEIVTANMIFDHEGKLLHTLPKTAGQWGATTMADLDGDDDLEIVLGNAAFHHDGTMMWTTNLAAGYPQVADLDADGLPEVLLTNRNGLSLIEHNGVVTYQDLRPTGVAPSGTNWHRPATIHDFDGDGAAEFAVSSASQYTVYEANASIVWSAPVQDASGIAAGTAFDFLGAGTAQAMYADEQNLFVFDGGGKVLLQVPRTSGTLAEYPVVADIDNDGSAEILVVSNAFQGMGQDYHCLRAIRDVQDRWIQARRIWNQHSYHVSNVREDGTIPKVEPKSWEKLNTFRTQAQVSLGGGVCQPIPQ